MNYNYMNKTQIELKMIYKAIQYEEKIADLKVKHSISGSIAEQRNLLKVKFNQNGMATKNFKE